MQMAVCTESQTSFGGAAGARRGILNIPGIEEDVGLIGIHWQGKFIELVPWNAAVSWEIAPWGQWKVRPIMISLALFICTMYVFKSFLYQAGFCMCCMCLLNQT